jgi:hypothetical protein
MQKIIRFSSNSFRKAAIHEENTKILIDSLEKHFRSLPSMQPKPISSPLLSIALPQSPIPFPEILKTIEQSVYPNTTHWRHPNFFAFFPVQVSWFAISGLVASFKEIQKYGQEFIEQSRLHFLMKKPELHNQC